MPRFYKGARVKVVEDGSPELVGEVAKVLAGVPYPYYIDVDVEASPPLTDDEIAHYAEHYSGPYAATSLQAVE